jgi:DNA-binding NarL/FixJ family response regulator
LISILIADDHTLVRQSIRQTLEREGTFNVVGEAADGEQAVVMAKNLKPDVILMDISMPKMTGIEATREIKLSQPQAKILILTAYDYDQYIFPLLEAGAAGYLLKDIESSELISAVKNVNRGDVVLHPSIARKVMLRFQRASKANGKTTQDTLSEREVSILSMAAKGMTNNTMAENLKLSVRTIEGLLTGIFNKLGVGSRTEAVIEAIKRGWIDFEEIS